MQQFYRVFSHDVTAAILVSQSNEAAAMLVSQTSPVGVELFSYANAFFCFQKHSIGSLLFLVLTEDKVI